MTLTNIVTIQSKNGMHLRPAGVLSQIASKTEYNDLGIFLLYEGIRADVKSVFNIMGLGAFHGAKLILEVEYDGNNENVAEKATSELLEFFETGYQYAEVQEDDNKK